MSNKLIDPTIINDGRTYDQLTGDHVMNKTQTQALVGVQTAGAKVYQGGYDASTNTPDLDTSPSGILKGHVYDVTVAGTFFTEDVEVGDQLSANQDDPTALAHWTVLQGNLTPASIKTKYESNADTNAFTDAEQTKLGGIEAGADVTDATNVDAAGATMNADTTLAGNGYFLDEDDMNSDDATKVPSQQSVKAYVDNSIPVPYMELHVVTATDVTNGFFTLANTPEAALSVLVSALNGTLQLHKQITNIGAETPDYDVLNTNELHINNNGAATGLSGDIIEGDKLIISYRG